MIVLIVGLVGFLFVNGVFDINTKNLDKSIQDISQNIPQNISLDIPQNIQKTTNNLKNVAIETSNTLQKTITDTPIDKSPDTEQIAIKIHELINLERTSKGLKPLGWNLKLVQASTNHSIDMATKGYFEHDSQDGRDFTYRYSQVGLHCQIPISSTRYSVGAENINFLDGYYGEDNIAREAVKGWMGSAGHRENILTNYFINEGIGVAFSSTGEIYITEDFC